jgi:DNA polymerase V
MGAPAYQWKEVFHKNNVHVLSSNYTLYGDMSQRVMHILARFSPDMEEYSIDEAFLYLGCEDPAALAREIKETVLKWTGIPVSIGIGCTKTLAKVANDMAKKREGIFAFTSAEQTESALEKLEVEEIWGIGRQLSAALKSEGIHHARAFKDCSDAWIKKRFSVMLLRTAYELRGIPCLSFNEQPVPRKSITCSRSFGNKLTALTEIEEALSAYVAIAAEKLRDEELLSSFLTVFLMTSSFIENAYSNSFTVTLDEPTAYTPQLTAKAKEALSKIFRLGYPYKKVGVILGGFFPKKTYQPDLFSGDEKQKERQRKAMQVIDTLNQRFGSSRLRFAAEGLRQNWKMQRGNVSARYTTAWDELLQIDI